MEDYKTLEQKINEYFKTTEQLNAVWLIFLSLSVIAAAFIAEYWTIWYMVNHQLNQLFSIPQINNLQVIAIMIFTRFLKFYNLNTYVKKERSVGELKKVMIGEIFGYLLVCGLAIFGLWILIQCM